jgi:hypothetical protein
MGDEVTSLVVNGAGCSNWKKIEIVREVVADLAECEALCGNYPECTMINWQPTACEPGGWKANGCLLFKDGCILENNDCFQMISVTPTPAPPPAPPPAPTPAPTSPQACFEAFLTANPVAVPDAVPPAVPVSSAYAKIIVNPDAVTTSINWTVPGVNATNKVIGLHIHQGDSHVNGGILVGFCGTDPLPPFSGPCEQGVNVVSYSVSGQACDITGSGSPCVDTSGAGTIGDASASLMANAADATAKYYLNLHTDQSFALSDDMALGLIRGQLQEVSC